MKYLLVALFVSLCACSTASPVKDTTIIRDTIIKIAPPMIIDSAQSKIEYYADKLDSSFRVLRTSQRDTIVDIRFTPKDNYIYWKIKPDTIFHKSRDTLRQVEYKIQAQSKFEKFGLFIAGAIAATILALVLQMIENFRKK